MGTPFNTTDEPLVSVIIPCFNHGKYLGEAIDSLLSQNYQQVEVIVVDDGSTDNTREAAARYPAVKYIYQQNQGLSAARNTGINESRGQYLVFLDADDWLYPGALAAHVSYLQKHPGIAFVSGAHKKVDRYNKVLEESKQLTIDNYYHAMLRGNYIEMHATVMYARWVFETFRYDTGMKACEDYDLYLNISRKFPVAHSNQLIAAYRFHTANMSGNAPLMLQTAHKALRRQYSLLTDDAERANWRSGMVFYQRYYCEKMVEGLFSHSGGDKVARRNLRELAKHPVTFVQCLSRRIARKFKRFLISILPFSVLKRLHRAGMHKNFVDVNRSVH